MSGTLLVTNDFPPRPGGIQSYLFALASRIPAELVVYTSTWRGAAEFDARQPFEVVREPTSVLLPTPGVRRRARELMASRGLTTVWFGAAAPLGLLSVDAERVVASTHGHEIGWSMLPPGRAALRRIGRSSDVVTGVSAYTRRRLEPAFGSPLAPLPPGVDCSVFRPDPAARATVRHRYGLGGRPVVVCVSRLVSRKGQDALIRALPAIRRRAPDAALLLVGDGPGRRRLGQLARSVGVADDVVFTGSVAASELPAHFVAGDVFAMPARTRGHGLDVEGLGLVYLEAAACGLPVVAGRSGGAPETVLQGETGYVVNGRSVSEVADAVGGLLDDPARAVEMGAAGRRWVQSHWRWDTAAAVLAALLKGRHH